VTADVAAIPCPAQPIVLYPLVIAALWLTSTAYGMHIAFAGLEINIG
jgi:hypothetical protein